MRVFTLVLALLPRIYRVAAQGTPGATDLATKQQNNTFTSLVNRDGWVNPEDLLAMPQCIAQQDQSNWLAAMSKCTSKRCTSHFGWICTHHQWLTQLSCLSVEFSPDLVSSYLPHCRRSVLAKAQLFRWIHSVTARNWLVDVGDASELSFLSPTSLTKGYSDIEVIDKAPTCLSDSFLVSSKEGFRHIIASCEFTAHAHHTGNKDRPWEYWESLQSMKSLDFETASYDFTGAWIAFGNYFDNSCFCNTFSLSPASERCSGETLDLTKEYMWRSATCGPASLPDNWKSALRTTEYDFIPIDIWRWPKCFPAMPKKVTKLFDQCAAEACERDSGGYCVVKASVDRACFCRKISYESCKSTCHELEYRKDYIQWLHGLCGREHGWQGLPKQWRELTAPTPLDMIPSNWHLIPTNSIDQAKPYRESAPIGWYLAYLVLVNLAPSYAVKVSRKGHCCSGPIAAQPWIPTGSMIAAVFLLAGLIKALIFQYAIPYDNISLWPLFLLCCSMPRATWPAILLLGFQPFTESTVPMIGSLLRAEVILQVFSVFCFISTVDYGREHNFYSQRMARIESMPSAQLMYGGALAWLVVFVVALVSLIQAFRIPARSRWSNVSQSSGQTSSPVFSATMYELTTPLNTLWSRLEAKAAFHFLYRSRDSEQSSLLGDDVPPFPSYGATLNKQRDYRIVNLLKLRMSLIALIGLGLVWTAQVIFWTGFASLWVKMIEIDRLCFLTTVWAVAEAFVAMNFLIF